MLKTRPEFFSCLRQVRRDNVPTILDFYFLLSDLFELTKDETIKIFDEKIFGIGFRHIVGTVAWNTVFEIVSKKNQIRYEEKLIC